MYLHCEKRKDGSVSFRIGQGRKRNDALRDAPEILRLVGVVGMMSEEVDQPHEDEDVVLNLEL